MLRIIALAAFLGQAFALVELNKISDTTIAPGQSITFEWSKNQGPVTINIRQGESKDLKTVGTVTSNASGNKFTWVVPADFKHTAGTDYAFEIIDSGAPAGQNTNYWGSVSVSGTPAAKDAKDAESKDDKEKDLKNKEVVDKESSKDADSTASLDEEEETSTEDADASASENPSDEDELEEETSAEPSVEDEEEEDASASASDEDDEESEETTTDSEEVPEDAAVSVGTGVTLAALVAAGVAIFSF